MDMEKIIDFNVFKEKIIKTSELIQLCEEKSIKLANTIRAYRGLKHNLIESQSKVSRLKLDNEQLSYRLNDLKGKEDELVQLQEQYYNLEQKYSENLMESQLQYQDFQQKIDIASIKKEPLELPKKSEEEINYLREIINQLQDVEKKIKKENAQLVLKNKELINDLENKKKALWEDKMQLVEKNQLFSYEIRILKAKLQNQLQIEYEKNLELEELKRTVGTSNIKYEFKDKEPVQETLMINETEWHLKDILKEMICPRAVSPFSSASSIGDEESHFLLSECKNTLSPILEITDKPTTVTSKPMPNIITPTSGYVEIGATPYFTKFRESNGLTKYHGSSENVNILQKSTKEVSTQTLNINRQKYRIRNYRMSKLKKRKVLNPPMFKKSKIITCADSVLHALQVLKRSNINFTISNESISNSVGVEYFKSTTDSYQKKIPFLNERMNLETYQCTNRIKCISCWSEKCNDNSYMFVDNDNLLGFSSKRYTPAINNVLPHNISSSSKDAESLLNQMLDGIKKLLQIKEPRKKKSQNWKRKRASNSEFHSETEPELERLFSKSNVLLRNKMLLQSAKNQNKNNSEYDIESDITNEKLKFSVQNSPLVSYSSSVSKYSPPVNSRKDSSEQSSICSTYPELLSPLASSSKEKSPLKLSSEITKSRRKRRVVHKLKNISAIKCSNTKHRTCITKDKVPVVEERNKKLNSPHTHNGEYIPSSSGRAFSLSEQLYLSDENKDKCLVLKKKCKSYNKPITKLKSKVLHQSRIIRSMFNDVNRSNNQKSIYSDNESAKDSVDSGFFDVAKKEVHIRDSIKPLKPENKISDLSKNMKINIIENVLINKEGALVNLMDTCSPKNSNQINISKKICRHEEPDILGKVMQDMRHVRSQIKKTLKPNVLISPVSATCLSSSENNHAIIANSSKNNSLFDFKIPDFPQSPQPEDVPERMPKIIPTGPTRKIEMSKAESLFNKLLNFSTDEEVVDKIAAKFIGQDTEYVARLMFDKVSTDVFEKATSVSALSPILTDTQRILLGFMARIKTNGHINIFEKFLSHSEHTLYSKFKCKLELIEPVTRLYTAICKFRRDINRMRRFVTEAFYFMDDFAVPLLFSVLTIWPEIMPMEVESNNFLLARVLVQIVLQKDCNKPGYNLLNLRSLLHKYYGYPNERWNPDVIFEEIFQEYLKNPQLRSSDFTLLLFVKNCQTKWVFQKLKSHLIPLLEKVPPENHNLQAMIIILIGNICHSFNKLEEYDSTVIQEIMKWYIQLDSSTTPRIVKQSIYLAISRLPKRAVKRKKSSSELTLEKK